MEYIGKSEKFYTLWEVNTETRTTMRGETYRVTTHQYIKNISFDLNKAKNKYPNAIVDTSLRGHSSWTSVDYPKPPVDEFQGGKYKGDKIADCTDYEYLCWAYDLGYIIHYDSRELVLSILEKNGYRKINDSHIATPEEVAKIEKSIEEADTIQELLEKEGKINVDVTKNLDEFGNVSVGNITLIFPEYKMMEYNGYPYALPLDSKGKAKRIKGKTLEIIPSSYDIYMSEYGWGAEININVKDFEIIK